jgi:hypothetical protein
VKLLWVRFSNGYVILTGQTKRLEEEPDLMKKSRIAVLSLSALLIVSMAGSAFAGIPGKVVNQRQCNQQGRIFQGAVRGQLTRNEVRNLMQSQRKINRYEQIARADGRITPNEFQKLNQMQQRQNQAIYIQKHDRQNRY